jgi:hypothetical protein
VRPNAVELSTAQAWFLADRLGAGNFPWVLAITQPYTDAGQRSAFDAQQVQQLTRMGVLSADGVVNQTVGQWIQLVCRPRRWLELRWVAASGELLRGLVVRDRERTVVALRNAHLMTCTELDVGHPQALVPVLTAGLAGRAPARFDQFSLPAHIGAKADERLRDGEALSEVVQYLGIPASAHHVVEAAFAAGRSYVEVVAGDHRDGYRLSTEVGVSVVDTAVGRVVVRPVKAADGTWISTFQPGTDMAAAIAVQQLTASLPDGAWFPDASLTRDFDLSSMERKEHVPQHIN